LILVFLEERFRPIHLLLEIWYMPYQQKIYIRLAGPVTDLAPRSPLCIFHIKLSLDEPQLDLRFVYTFINLGDMVFKYRDYRLHAFAYRPSPASILPTFRIGSDSKAH
jgi:hypothetical protein